MVGAARLGRGDAFELTFAPEDPGAFRPRLMLLVRVAFIIAVFTRSHSKLPCHIVLVFPAVALLIASYLD